VPRRRQVSNLPRRQIHSCTLLWGRPCSVQAINKTLRGRTNIPHLERLVIAMQMARWPVEGPSIHERCTMASGGKEAWRLGGHADGQPNAQCHAGGMIAISSSDARACKSNEHEEWLYRSCYISGFSSSGVIPRRWSKEGNYYKQHHLSQGTQVKTETPRLQHNGGTCAMATQWPASMVLQ
jgi:hypothetical protein